MSTTHLNQLVSIVSKKVPNDGIVETIIPFLSFIRSEKPTLLNQGVLQPSFCIILQGRKQMQLGSEIVRYGAGDYLASTIEVPTAGQVVGASKAAPYLGLRIGLDPGEIASIVLEAKIDVLANRKTVSGTFVKKSDEELQTHLLKLVKLLDHPQDAAFLAESVKREMIYRLLTGPDGYLFYQNIMTEKQDAGVGKAMLWLKANFARPLKMEQLAKRVNMSVSSLHHKFKAVAAMGPLQYQKQLRLQEARRLLLGGAVDASSVAYQVGYESLSQFSREYRRLFGAPPMKDIKNLRIYPVQVTD